MPVEFPTAPPPAPAGEPYATVPDVILVLGKIGPRLPAEIDPATFVAMAHAEVVAELAKVYTRGLPAFTGDGLEAVRWSEAKLAAAGILEVIWASVQDVGETPDILRRSALRTLAGGVVGYPPGSITDDPNAPGVPLSSRPQVSSSTNTSMFPDPYFDARDDPLRPWV